MAVVVAICGARGDAAAEVMCREAGFANLGFTRPLKDAVAQLFGLDDVHFGALKDAVHPAWGVTPAALLSWFGTDVMQHGLRRLVPAPAAGGYFWTTKLIGAARDVLWGERGGCSRVVVGDLRFAHELAALRAEFGDRLVAVRINDALSTTASTATASTATASTATASTATAELESHDVDVVINATDEVRSLFFGSVYRRARRSFGKTMPTRDYTARLVSARRGRVFYRLCEDDSSCDSSSSSMGGGEVGAERACDVAKWLWEWELV